MRAALTMKPKDIIPSSFRRPLGRAKNRTWKSLEDTWFHFQNGTLGRLVVVVGTSYRVGSTWLYHMLRDIAHCTLGKERAPSQLLRNDTLLLELEAYDFLRELRGHFIFKSHSFPPDSETRASCAKFVSIYRDPRDVLVSASFFFAHLEEEKGGLGAAFRQLPVSERIRFLLLDRSDLSLLAKLEAWYETPLAYKTRYEDLIRQPVDELGRIAEFIGVSTKTEAIKSVVLNHSFKAKSGRAPGEQRENHRMRKGVVGDWHIHFDRTCIDAFKTQQGERWNRLLVAMGYENSLDWT
jgi:hypothetical protein